MAAVKLQVGMDDLWPDGSRGDEVTIEISPDDGDGDDGDDVIVTVVVRKPKPDKPRSGLHLVSKASSPSAAEGDTLWPDGPDGWFAHML